MTELADILQQIQDAVNVNGATVEVKDNDIVVTFPNGTVQIFEGAAHLMGSGATRYDDDMGDLIDLIDAQGVIPPVAMAFSVPVIENELSVFEQVVNEGHSVMIDEDHSVVVDEDQPIVDDHVIEECIIEVPETGSVWPSVSVDGIIHNAVYTGISTWLNTENPFAPIHQGPLSTWGTEDNDFIMTNAVFIDGLDGDDFIFTPYDNTWAVIGHDGNDVILDFYSYGANLIGGDGDDLIVSLFGENNILAGNEGNDTLIAFGYDHILDGGDGDDTLLAIGGNNSLYGGEGNDILIAIGGEYQSEGGGYNVLYGGAGHDCLHGADYVMDYLYGGTGNDFLDGGIAYDYYSGDNLSGGDGNDTLVAYTDYYYGGLVGYYDGGADFDRLDLSKAGNELYDFYNVSNIEQLDMEDGDIDSMYLSVYDVINMTDDDNELFITGDEGDKLYLGGEIQEDWSKIDCDCKGTDGNSYDTYTMAGATIFVDTDILVNPDMSEYA